MTFEVPTGNGLLNENQLTEGLFDVFPGVTAPETGRQKRIGPSQSWMVGCQRQDVTKKTSNEREREKRQTG